MNLANQLTMLRIGLAVAVFIALMQPTSAPHVAAFFLFLAAIITDWIDGWVARRTNSISAFGKVADPIADKILVLGALIALLHTRELEIPLWGVFLILARELLIGGLRILASSQGKISGAEPWGKWKMGVQSVAVLMMVALLAAKDRVSPALAALPYYLTVLCVVVAWGSAALYFRQSRKMLEKTWT